MITNEGIQEIAESILGIVSHGEVIIDNETKHIELYRTNISVNIVKIFFKLDDTLRGEITSSKVISKSGKILIDKAEKIEKDMHGLLLVFSIKLTEVEV
ncbi:hypothetical protein [uncultured Tissierella sp.]|uniref:hypothetical protein n=1 Tax=uncultured Tissierella sp. TaxID=448160 RepID=UPI002804DC11|nr:hypothetical protein [uncultured Tissierella sp.]MDU5080220.1 hypothetical protein [Bacillota bacterium]